MEITEETIREESAKLRNICEGKGRLNGRRPSMEEAEKLHPKQ